MRVASVAIERRTLSNSAEVVRFEVPWQTHEWHQVKIRLKSRFAAVDVDGVPYPEVALPSAPAGGIGLWLGGGSSGCFDDVHVRSLADATQSDEAARRATAGARAPANGAGRR